MIDKKALIHVAKIAHISLTDKEIKEFLPQLKEVISACESLQKVKTKEKLIFHPIKIPFADREDTLQECVSQEEALSLTKSTKEGYIKGPKIL